jgi:hypothetical protein
MGGPRHRLTPAGFSLASTVVTALQATDRDDKVRPIKYLNQPIKEALVIMRPGFEIFFDDALGGTFNWQRESLCLLRARHPVCHIAWTNEHVGASYDGLLMPPS